MKPSEVRHPGHLLTIVAIIFTGLWSCSDTPEADAGVRRACVRCVQRAVYAAPYVKPSLAYYPAVQYMIGAGIRQEAVAEFSYREELVQLRAYKQGVETAAALAQAAVQRAQQAVEGTPPDGVPDGRAVVQEGYPPQQGQPWLEDGQPAPTPQMQPGPPQQPTPPMAQMSVQPNTMSPMLAPFASHFPAIVAACGSCHREGGKAADYVRLDGSRNVLDPAECELREAMFRRMLSTDPEVQMPPNKPLAPEVLEAIVFELYGGQGAQ